VGVTFEIMLYVGSQKKICLVKSLKSVSEKQKTDKCFSKK
jgi:hypothetical protein